MDGAWNFACKCVEGGGGKVNFVMTNLNDKEMMTTNLVEPMFTRYASKLVGKCPSHLLKQKSIKLTIWEK